MGRMGSGCWSHIYHGLMNAVSLGKFVRVSEHNMRGISFRRSALNAKLGRPRLDMKVDFTVNSYRELLNALKMKGFFFQTVYEFIEVAKSRTILLRHDVDLLPENSLAIGRIENELGICATYYFRAVPESWNEGIIREIASLGHEVGYHYESLTTCTGNVEQAFDDFKRNLEKLRELVPVFTICMHGSPRSPWDSRNMWKVYDYRSLGIVCEPYLDMDFGEVFYLTDTGRRWDGWKVSVRDKMPQQQEWVRQGLVFHTTTDIIFAAERGNLPDRTMITVHPQRWDDRPWPWVRELISQRVKNVVKARLIKGR